METVELDWSKMNPTDIITVWLKPDEKTETYGGRRITNRQWCEEEMKRVIAKGKKVCLVTKKQTGEIALLRR